MMAWDNQGGRNTKPKPRGLPTQRSSGVPSYLQDRAQIQQARQRQQQQQQQQQQSIANNPYRTTTAQSVQPQAVTPQAQQQPNLWNAFLNFLRGSPYQGLTDANGQPLIPHYVNPQVGPVDAWGVNQQPQRQGYVPATGSTLNPRGMADWRNQGLVNNPSRKIVRNTSIYSVNAPSVPLDTGAGGGGYGDWGYGGGGGGGGWNDNYVASWYNSLINWTIGEPKK